MAQGHARTPVRRRLMDLPVPLERLGWMATPVIAFALLIWTLEKLNQHVFPALARARYMPRAINRMFRRWAHRIVEEEAARKREDDREQKIDRLLQRSEEMATQLRPNGGTDTTIHDVVDRIETRVGEIGTAFTDVCAKVDKACNDIELLLHAQDSHDGLHDQMQAARESDERAVLGLLGWIARTYPDRPGGPEGRNT